MNDLTNPLNDFIQTRILLNTFIWDKFYETLWYS